MAKDKKKFNQIIHHMLISDNKAKTVNLTRSDLDINDIELLCYAIEHGRTTQKIILSSNSIDDRKIKLIASALIKNVGLLEIVLSDNNINNLGVIAINNALLANEKIHDYFFSINLCNNLFDLTMVRAHLLNNSKFKYLNLSANLINREGELSFHEEYKFSPKSKKRLRP